MDDGSDPDSDYETVLIDSKFEITYQKQVGPLLNTRWGQFAPWNDCVPYWRDSSRRCPTGCTAVAGAQMLYYFHQLKNIPAQFYTQAKLEEATDESGKRINFYSYRNLSDEAWEQMARRAPAYVENATKGSHLVSILMRWVGDKVKMDYHIEGSGAPFEALVELYKLFGISSSYTGYDSKAIRASLDKQLPVNIVAYKKKVKDYILWFIPNGSHPEEGHAWIIDGYKEVHTSSSFTYEHRPKFKSGEDIHQKVENEEPPPYEKWHDENGVELPKHKHKIPIGRTTHTFSSVSIQWFMNFGWNGAGNDATYAIGDGAVWDAGGHSFQFGKGIIHNFSFPNE